MLYVPRYRSDFYGRPAFERLMQRLAGQGIRYLIVGGGELDAPPGEEAINLGWRDNLPEIYKDVSMLIRYTPHDGLSLMVLEALSFGRHVAWTQQFPFVRTIRSYAEMEDNVRTLHELHQRGELQPQHAASVMIEKDFAPDACVNKIVHAWNDALRSGLPPQLAVEVR
jgi:glycosyltransferase involved in cell wall biosynthesis